MSPEISATAPRKKRRLGGAVILVTAMAFVAGYYLRSCGTATVKTGKAGQGKQKQAEKVKKSSERKQPKMISVRLKDDKLFHGEREIDWQRFSLLMREAYEKDQQLKLVVYPATVHTEVMRRVERELGQGGVRYFIVKEYEKK